MNIAQGKSVFVTNALIDGDLNLRMIPGLIIDTPIVIRSSTIQGSVFLPYAIFNQDVDFSGTTITKGANFMYAKFQNNAIFGGTRFNGSNIGPSENSFEFVKFNKPADFSGATFNGTTGFYRSTFNGTANFMRSNFEKDADFVYAKFNEGADFTQARFYNAQFSYAIFNKDATFLGSHFQDADFGYAQFNENANFYAWFDGRLDLSFARLTQFEILWDSIKHNLVCDGSVYSTLIKYFKDQGRFDDADNCYYQFRQQELNQESWLSWSGIFDILAWVTCGYGVRWYHTLLSAIGAMLLFGFYFSDKEGIVKLHKLGEFPDITKSIYFSTIILISAPTDWYTYLFSEERYREYIINNKYSIILERLVGWGLVILLINTLIKVMIRY